MILYWLFQTPVLKGYVIRSFRVIIDLCSCMNYDESMPSGEKTALFFIPNFGLRIMTKNPVRDREKNEAFCRVFIFKQKINNAFLILSVMCTHMPHTGRTALSFHFKTVRQLVVNFSLTIKGVYIHRFPSLSDISNPTLL